MIPLPFIDRFSLDELQRISTGVRWGIWGFGAIAIMLTWAGHKITDRIQALQLVEKGKAKERQILAEKETEVANQRLADLEAETETEGGYARTN